DALLDLGALRGRSLIVPEDGRTENAVVLVQADKPVHLPREADPGGLASEGRECPLGRAPPVLGVLLGPARLRSRERILLLGARDHVALRGDRDRLDTGRPHVDADRRFHGETFSQRKTRAYGRRTRRPASSGACHLTRCPG